MARRNLLGACLAFIVTCAAASTDTVPFEVKQWLAGGEYQRALSWLSEASGQGNPRAALLLAKLYQRGDGVPENSERAAALLTVAAEANLAEAQYLIGLHHEDEGDRAASIRWLRAAADQGHSRAKARLDKRPSTGSASAYAYIEAGDIPDPAVLSRLDPMQADDSGATPLIHAVKHGRFQWVRAMLADRADVTTIIGQRDLLGNTALHHAAQLADVPMLQMLLELGADTRAKNDQAATALHLAVAATDAAPARMLLRFGADFDAPGKGGWSSRMLAERSSNSAIASLAGPRKRTSTDLDLASENTDQLLFHAARNGNAELISDLVGTGVRLEQTDDAGNTALNVAARFGQTAVVQQLLAAGASHTTSNANGHSPLMQAAAGSHAGIVEALLRAGAQPDTTDTKNRSALHHAISGKCVDCVSHLLDMSANVSQRDANGDSALVLAAKGSLVDVGRSLTAAGSPIELGDNQQRSPLWWAVSAQSLPFAELLLEAGATLAPNTDGVNPLHVATQFDSDALVDLVLDAATSEVIGARTTTGNAAINLAAFHDNAHAVTRLIDAGADVESATPAGDSALITAVNARAIASARALIEAGASLNRRNDQRMSARVLIEEIDEPAWQRLLDDAPSEIESLIGRITD